MTNELHSLARSVRALAQPATVQRRLYPAFVCVPDELVLDFDDAYRAVATASLQSEQAAALKALDELLSALSGPAHADLWSDEALAADPRWDTIRQLARDVLDAFGWRAEPVEPNGAIYVGGGQQAEETRPPALLLTVADTFLIKGRGLIVVPGPPPDSYPHPADLTVELQRPDGLVTRTRARLMMEFLSPPPPPGPRPLVCMLPEVTKQDVPIGTQVWVLGHVHGGAGERAR